MEDQDILNWAFKVVTAVLGFFGVRVWGMISQIQKESSELKSEQGRMKGKINLVEQNAQNKIDSFKELTTQRFDNIESRLEEIKDLFLEKLK